ncbi:hypothetical protein AOLI_G00247820 [Acnodon oligacanthus]
MEMKLLSSSSREGCRWATISQEAEGRLHRAEPGEWSEKEMDLDLDLIEESRVAKTPGARKQGWTGMENETPKNLTIMFEFILSLYGVMEAERASPTP